MIAEAKEKARRDEADWLWGIEQENNRAIEIALRMLSRNRPIAEIVEDTGLTTDEVLALGK
ncbi:MAG: hypothetical protein LBH17_01990 [Oscillospiraceae bacterium]|jgi:predicted transposase YdaD|nr:hypothetical protein [Oscillospiraceae bacterium]